MNISVAIATYNRRAMVRQAIEAALAQSRPPEEIVVSDDASTDGTAATLDEIASRDSRVRVLRQRTNSGGVGNWNAAMRASTGEYLAWCSDDDRFTRQHLADSVGYLERHPEIAMVHSSFFDSFEGAGERALNARRLRSAWPIVIGSGHLLRYMMRYYNWPFHPSTIVMRREVWKQTGEFDPQYALADTDWFVRAAAVTRIALLPRHGAINRRHRGNWSNRVGSAAMQREIFEIVDRALGSRPPLLRAISRAVWRVNVRARLCLTIQARIASEIGRAHV
jgi:glycosyltransferase involved in cell wall biosynthesis